MSRRALEMITNTAPFDITHHPAMSLPCGMVDGLPVGLMLVGRHFDEIDDLSRRACLRTVRRLEEDVRRLRCSWLDRGTWLTLSSQLFEILSFGAIIVLVVLGLGIIASMMGIFNFAQGEFVLLGAYITYLAYSHGLPVWIGMVAAPFLVGALGFVLEALIIRRFYAAPIVAMLGTYALGLIIRESVRGLIGGLYLSVPEPIGGSIDFGSRARLGLALRHHRHHARW